MQQHAGSGRPWFPSAQSPLGYSEVAGCLPALLSPAQTKGVGLKHCGETPAQSDGHALRQWVCWAAESHPAKGSPAKPPGDFLLSDQSRTAPCPALRRGRARPRLVLRGAEASALAVGTMAPCRVPWEPKIGAALILMASKAAGNICQACPGLCG